MNDDIAKPSPVSFWFSAVIIVGCFLIFAFVLYVAYIPSRPREIGPAANLTAQQRQELNLLSPAERQARLVELRNREARAAASYEWVDREKGIVRLPLERAMELTVQELSRPPQTRAR